MLPAFPSPTSRPRHDPAPGSSRAPRPLPSRLRGSLLRPGPARLVALGYAVNMLLRWARPSLPLASGAPSRAIDDLLIAVSAVSTTGLVLVDPGSTYTRFGQVVILLLIQAGGLGFMTVSSFAFTLIASGPSRLRNEVARAVFSLPASVQPRVFVGRVVTYTVVVEAGGTAGLAWLLASRAIPDRLWHGLFLSVSSFCTAGFSLVATSFEDFADDPAVLLVIALLSNLGAVGLLVASEAWDGLRGKVARLSLSTRIILAVTGLTIALGTAGLSLGVTGELSDSGKVVVMVLMVLMYVGRVGGLAFAVALAVRAREAKTRAAVEDIAV